MSLDKLREKIDQLDEKLIELLNERINIALEIGKAKKEQGGEIYVPSREKAVFDRICRLNKNGPLPDKSARAIYREVMSAALALESNLKIAYLGPPATFTHSAARSKFGASVEYHPAGSIDDVFSAVETGNADYGVVPVENSTEGAVTNTFDRFTGTTLKICNEIYQPISLCLMATVPMDQIPRICTKHEAIGQCRRWLAENMSGVEYDAVASTTIAAEMATRGECAAIASRFAAELYGLDLIAENIQDSIGNTTRFLVIGKAASEPTGNDKTSIFFGVKDKIGALNDALIALKNYGINMSKIESRPSGDNVWQYVFFVDFEGHVDDPNVVAALTDLEEHCAVLNVLGSYPRAAVTD